LDHFQAQLQTLLLLVVILKHLMDFKWELLQIKVVEEEKLKERGKRKMYFIGRKIQIPFALFRARIE